MERIKKKLENDVVGSAIGSQSDSESGSVSSNLIPTSKNYIDPYNLKVSYHQVGSKDDVVDWIYSYVCNKLLSSALPVFKFSASGNVENATNFIKEVCKITKIFVRFADFSHRKKVTNYVATNADYESVLQISHSRDGKEECVDFYFVSSSPETVKELESFCKANILKPKDSTIYVISTRHGGLSLHNLGYTEATFERGNYTKEVLEGYDYLLKEFNSLEPYGRLAIINGPPGTGKTYLVKALLSEIRNCLIVLLPAKLVSEVDSPQIISLFIEEKVEYGSFGDSKNSPILFIIEDADACLVPREGDNVMTISSLLNYTDGILGSTLDLRIIATTNADHIEFDEALTRPGRLCRHIYVGELSPEKASEVYKRLTGVDKSYNELTTLAQVYADANGKFKKVTEDKKVLGFGK